MTEAEAAALAEILADLAKLLSGLFGQHRTTDPVPNPLAQVEWESRLKLGNEGKDDG